MRAKYVANGSSKVHVSELQLTRQDESQYYIPVKVALICRKECESEDFKWLHMSSMGMCCGYT